MIDQPGEERAEGSALWEIGREAVLSEYSNFSQEMGCFQVKKNNTDKKTEVKLEIVWRQRSLRKFQMEKQFLGVHRQSSCSQMWRMKSKSPTRSGQASIRGFQASPWNEAGFQTPRVQDFMYCLRDCKIFTKLDLRQGYHQLAQDSSTRQAATFKTPWRNYRLPRLLFGAKSSQKNWCLWRSPDPESLETRKVGGVVIALAFQQCGPDSIPWPEIICGLSLLVLFFVMGLPEFFSFPLSPKRNIWFDLICCDFTFICNLLNW